MTGVQGDLVMLRFFVAHFLADFVFQTKALAQAKRRSARYLLLHTAAVFVSGVALFSFDLMRVLPWIAAISVSHGIVDLISGRLLPADWRAMLGDQVVHWAAIAGACALIQEHSLRAIVAAARTAVSDSNWLALVLGYLISVFFGRILVDKVCDWFDPEKAGGAAVDAETARLEDAAGGFIGMVERFLVTTFILYGQYGAVGYVFAAKSLSKVADPDHDKRLRFPAYYLVGTLSSFAVAVFAGMLMSRLLQK